MTNKSARTPLQHRMLRLGRALRWSLAPHGTTYTARVQQTGGVQNTWTNRPLTENAHGVSRIIHVQATSQSNRKLELGKNIRILAMQKIEQNADLDEKKLSRQSTTKSWICFTKSDMMDN